MCSDAWPSASSSLLVDRRDGRRNFLGFRLTTPSRFTFHCSSNPIFNANQSEFSFTSLSWGSPIPQNQSHQDNKQQSTLLIGLHQRYQYQCCNYERLKIFFHTGKSPANPDTRQILQEVDKNLSLHKGGISPEPANVSVMVWFSKKLGETQTTGKM